MSEVELDESFDFGFSSVTEQEVIGVSYEEKLYEMFNMIVPLLDNLAKDADEKPYIHWPDRKKKLQEFKKKLQAILDK